MNPYWWLLAALIAVNLAVLPYFLFLLATSLSAIISGTREHLGSDNPSSKILIVIPAHNEQSGIATTVRSCLDASYPSLLFGVTVIADNCTDQTAAVARDTGARVCERFDDVKKSKGYAIEFLLESLRRSGELDSLDAVVIVDADTTIDPNLLRPFDHGLRRGHDWMQAYYTVANPDQSWRTRLMTYAFSMFNGVMQLGQNALGSRRASKAMECASRPAACAAPLEVLRPGGRHGVLVDTEGRRREDLVRPRSFGLWGDARVWRKRRGQSTPTVGVRPERHPQEIPGLIAAVHRARLVGQSAVDMRIDHPVHGHAGGDLYHPRQPRHRSVAHDNKLGPLRNASLFGCERGRHDPRIVCLCNFTLPGDAAPVEIPLQHPLFPILCGLEADHLTGWQASPMGSDGPRAGSMNSHGEAEGPLRIWQRIC